MDYKSIYSASLEETMNHKEQEIISTLQESKKKNKNFRNISNGLRDQIVKEKELCWHCVSDYPDLQKAYKNRYNEYENDHLESFIKEYSSLLTKEVIEDLGRYEALCIAEEKYGATEELLELIYVLNEGFDQYILNFSPDNNPLQSDLFYKLQTKRYAGKSQEANWEKEVLAGSTNNFEEEEEEAKKIENKESLEIKFEPGSSLSRIEKLYILHLLHDLINIGSEMTTTEFLRILHLTVEVIDTSADITGNPPNYRRVNDGFFKDDPTYRNRDLIKSIFAKIHDYQLPMLKQILQDKLIALPGK